VGGNGDAHQRHRGRPRIRNRPRQHLSTHTHIVLPDRWGATTVAVPGPASFGTSVTGPGSISSRPRRRAARRAPCAAGPAPPDRGRAATLGDLHDPDACSLDCIATIVAARVVEGLLDLVCWCYMSAGSGGPSAVCCVATTRCTLGVRPTPRGGCLACCGGLRATTPMTMGPVAWPRNPRRNWQQPSPKCAAITAVPPRQSTFRPTPSEPFAAPDAKGCPPQELGETLVVGPAGVAAAANHPRSRLQTEPVVNRKHGLAYWLGDTARRCSSQVLHRPYSPTTKFE